jgi:hypothetical protein
MYKIILGRGFVVPESFEKGGGPRYQKGCETMSYPMGTEGYFRGYKAVGEWSWLFTKWQG